MGKVNVYLPDDLERDARDAGVSISAVCQAALRSVLDTVAVLDGRASGTGANRLTARLAAILEDLEAHGAETGREITVPDLFGAVVRHGENLGAHALRNLGVELPPPRSTRPRRAKSNGGFTPDARERLVAAVRVALDMRHNYVGTEHVVIALSEEESPIHDLFVAVGLDARGVRAEVERLLTNPWRPPVSPPASRRDSASSAQLVARFEAELQRLSEELGEIKGRLGTD